MLEKVDTAAISEVLTPVVAKDTLLISDGKKAYGAFAAKIGIWKTMTLAPHEFIRRFLIHVLPKGLHRIRHYDLFANINRAANLVRARELLDVPAPVPEAAPEPTATSESEQPTVLPQSCPCCGGRMIVIELFEHGCTPKHRPSPLTPLIGIDTS